MLKHTNRVTQQALFGFLPFIGVAASVGTFVLWSSLYTQNLINLLYDEYILISNERSLIKMLNEVSIPME